MSPSTIPDGSQRRLAAIMFTDMVGYTALGQRDESLALTLVDEQRKLVRPILKRHNGREIKTIGDAFLVDFTSALDAVRCAYDIQRAVREFNFSQPEERRIHLRVGIHLGDIVLEPNGDISGDAVNVASRIEPLATDGGVCVTRQVFDHIHNKFDLGFSSLGQKSLKNVSSPLEIYEMIMPWQEETLKAFGARNQQQIPPAADPKRIAVLPFANMSPDPNDEYFADGITEEIISTMSKIDQVEVISRTSVMQYKKNPKPVREISKELDVGTILEGSVRKSGDRVRVTIQAIDPLRDRHLWAESYDRSIRDVFGIQIEIANHVAEALKVRILPSDSAKLRKPSTTNPEAYTLYLKGRYYWNERTKEGIEKAIQYFTEAARLDPGYARAYAGLADAYMILENWGYLSPSEASPRTRMYATKAIESDSSLAEAHTCQAVMLMTQEWDIEGTEREFRRAIELNPNYATAHHWYANGFLNSQGRHEEAISQMREAKRLDPLSPMVTTNLGDRFLAAKRLAEAEAEYRSVLQTYPDFAYTHSSLGLALIEQHRYEEGIAEIQESLLKGRGAASVSDLIFAYYEAGRKEDAEKQLQELGRKHALNPRYGTNVDLAKAYAAVNNVDKAIEFFSAALSEKSNQIFSELNAPHFDKLCLNPRFKELLRNIQRSDKPAS